MRVLINGQDFRRYNLDIQMLIYSKSRMLEISYLKKIGSKPRIFYLGDDNESTDSITQRFVSVEIPSNKGVYDRLLSVRDVEGVLDQAVIDFKSAALPVTFSSKAMINNKDVERLSNTFGALLSIAQRLSILSAKQNEQTHRGFFLRLAMEYLTVIKMRLTQEFIIFPAGKSLSALFQNINTDHDVIADSETVRSLIARLNVQVSNVAASDELEEILYDHHLPLDTEDWVEDHLRGQYKAIEDWILDSPYADDLRKVREFEAQFYDTRDESEKDPKNGSSYSRLWTVRHQMAVTVRAYDIARALNLPDNYILKIAVAAAIHDVGKTQVEYWVLNFPGKFADLPGDEREFYKAAMDKHMEYGDRILKELDIPSDIREIAMQHHERLDGEGYPNRLKAEEITFGGKVLAVADAFSALREARPYRKSGIPVQKAVDIIKSETGTRFDQRVVDALEKIAPYLREESFSSRAIESIVHLDGASAAMVAGPIDHLLGDKIDITGWNNWVGKALKGFSAYGHLSSRGLEEEITVRDDQVALFWKHPGNKVVFITDKDGFERMVEKISKNSSPKSDDFLDHLGISPYGLELWRSQRESALETAKRLTLETATQLKLDAAIARRSEVQAAKQLKLEPAPAPVPKIKLTQYISGMMPNKMNVEVYDRPEEVNRRGGKEIADIIETNNNHGENSVIFLFTGTRGKTVTQAFVQQVKERNIDLSKTKIFYLDEYWMGKQAISGQWHHDPRSYRYFAQANLIDPLNTEGANRISWAQVFVLDGESEDTVAQAKRWYGALTLALQEKKQSAPGARAQIDIIAAGSGSHGHLAFIEETIVVNKQRIEDPNAALEFRNNNKFLLAKDVRGHESAIRSIIQQRALLRRADRYRADLKEGLENVSGKPVDERKLDVLVRTLERQKLTFYIEGLTGAEQKKLKGIFPEVNILDSQAVYTSLVGQEELSFSTIIDNYSDFIDQIDTMTGRALTVKFGILALAKRVRVFAYGPKTTDVMGRLSRIEKFQPDLPLSVLLSRGNAKFILDQEAAGRIDKHNLKLRKIDLTVTNPELQASSISAAMTSVMVKLLVEKIDQENIGELIGEMSLNELFGFLEGLEKLINGQDPIRVSKESFVQGKVVEALVKDLNGRKYYFSLSPGQREVILRYLSNEQRISIYSELLDSGVLSKRLEAEGTMRGWLEENAGYSFFQINGDLEGMFTGSDLILYYGQEAKKRLDWEKEIVPYIKVLDEEDWKSDGPVESITLLKDRYLMINQSGRLVASIDLQVLRADLQSRNEAMISDEVELRQKLSEAKGLFIIGIAESVAGLIYSFSSNDWQGSFGVPLIFSGALVAGTSLMAGRRTSKYLKGQPRKAKMEVNAAMASQSRALKKARTRGDEWPMSPSKATAQPTEEQNDAFLAILLGQANALTHDLDRRIKFISRHQTDAGTPIQYRTISFKDFSEILKHPERIEFRQKIKITQDKRESFDVPLEEISAENLASASVVHFYRDSDRKINWYYLEGSDHWPILIKTRDPAMAGQGQVDQVGGIDLGRSRLNVRQEGQGVRMQFDPAMIARIRHDGFDGLNFHIQSIIPVTDLSRLLGLKPSAV